MSNIYPEIQVPAFKIVSVFDVSQTEGEPLPSIGVEELTGSVERYGEFFKALEQTSLLVSTPDQKKIDFLYPQISLPIIPAIAVY